ncbi:unnamed protein product [Phytophthora fragariaefolia]|uniref:Unnamed protein product n=1 Tax=Phytophthora fragariaefolia TaxID=1490495 RepID=A0A9W6X525_9STRA|nr:unnamed protein product [Phytophthora fragariaefolia]
MIKEPAGRLHRWVLTLQEFDFERKARPKAVVPPLKSAKTGDVRDRWVIDVSGSLPETIHGNRYMIAAVEYTTRELGSKVTTELLALMQVKQATPVPYRPSLPGLVERFHRTWKYIVSLYVDEEQTDWDDFVPSALYAYNSSTHTTHGFHPNELMMGRKLRTPADLLRRSRLTYPHATLAEYHEVLTRDLKTASELAAVALQKEHARQAIYYNGRPRITKFGHRWCGPAQIVEAAGYDNFKVKMLELEHELVVHCSFPLPFYYPLNLLDQMAKDITLDLREEAIAAADIDEDVAPNAEQKGLGPSGEEQASRELQKSHRECTTKG